MTYKVCCGCGESGSGEREQGSAGVVDAENVPDTRRKNHCGYGSTEEHGCGFDGSPFDRLGFYLGAREDF